MLYRKGITDCSCANALYPAQAIQWVKCNFTHFSTNFRFEYFSWTLLKTLWRATSGPRTCS